MVLEHGAGWEVIGTHATGNETKETLCGFLPPQSLKIPWYFIFLKPECPTVFFFFFKILSYLVKPVSSISPLYVSGHFLLLSIKYKLIKHFFFESMFSGFIYYLFVLALEQDNWAQWL